MIGSSISLRSWIPRYEIVHRKEPESRLHPWNVRVSRSRIALITHAPVWGERALIPLEQRYKWLQLTPPCGGEPGQRTTYPRPRLSFNSRPPDGGRTSDTCRICWPASALNSRPRVGANHALPVLERRQFWLQLTPPCGGEQQNCTISNSQIKNITERLKTSLLFALRHSIQSITFLQNYRFRRCEPNWKFCELQVRTD